MPRKNERYRHVSKMKVKTDTIHSSFWFAKFINKFMQNGKKIQVETPILKAFSKVKQKEKKLMTHLLFRSLIKIRPLFGFISRRFGREIKKIPTPLFSRRQTIIALDWYVVSIKLIFLPSLYRKIKSALYIFPKKNTLFAIARNRRQRYDRALYKHRLNRRWRWK